MRRNSFLTLTLAIAAGFLLSLPAAYADTVSLTLATQGICGPYICGTAGSTVSVIATAAAPITNAADIYLNSDDFTVTVPLSVDDSPFFTNFPFSLTPGQSYTDVLFNITIPAGATPGYYTGYFDLLGGPDGGNFSDFDVLASVPFTVDVTPEPSSFLLLGSGIAGMIAAFKRRKLA